MTTNTKFDDHNHSRHPDRVAVVEVDKDSSMGRKDMVAALRDD